MEIPDDLLCLFSGRIERRDGRYYIEVPANELQSGTLEEGDSYRVGLLPGTDTESTPQRSTGPSTRRSEPAPEPPVEEGEVRTVEIEGIGDQGDGIAKIERGFVLIVPDTQVGDEVTVEVREVRQNVAFAEVIE
jgi:predicted RNA-binding protein with TRAM domain